MLEALSTERGVRHIARDASLADIVADFKSGTFADEGKYPKEDIKYLLRQTKDGDRVITAFAKIADAQDLKRYSFWVDYEILKEIGGSPKEKLSTAHILALRSATNGWGRVDGDAIHPSVLKLQAQGVPDPSRGWTAGIPENYAAAKVGDTVAHYLARFSEDWWLPDYTFLENPGRETVLEALLNSAGFPGTEIVPFEMLLLGPVEEDLALKVLTKDNLDRLNAKLGFKRYLLQSEIKILDPETKEVRSEKVADFLKNKGVGGHEASGSLEDMINKTQVQELSVYYRENVEDPIVLAEEPKILEVKNSETSVPIEVAKVIDAEDKGMLERPWVKDISVLEKKDADGMTVAHYLAIGSSASGWGSDLSLDVYSLKTETTGDVTPHVREDGKKEEPVKVEVGDTVAHYLVRFNPKWTTEDEAVLELRNDRNESVAEVIRLRSGEATPLKELNPDELQAFRARFKRLQYNAQELARTFKWLYLAEFENAEIEIERKGNYIIWKNGTWLDGEWLVGKWLNGTFKNGVWKSGNWVDGVWEDGVWHEGEWDGGTWKKGKWLDGTWHNGVWEGGVFQEGIWKNGEWKDGTWGHGVWLEGSYKGKKRQAGVWSGDVWEKEANEYVKPKKSGKFTAQQLIGRFKKINGFQVPDIEDENANSDQYTKVLKDLVLLIDEKHFPWLAYLDTDYEKAEVFHVNKGVGAGSLLWLGGNWKSGRWGVTGVWQAKKGKFTGKDWAGKSRRVPPTSENSGAWDVTPVLTEEMTQKKGWLKGRLALLQKQGKPSGEKTPEEDKVKKDEPQEKPRGAIATAAAEREEAAKGEADKAKSMVFTTTKKP